MKDPIFIDNEKYISTKEASILFDYTSDYVGQLAREGRIASTKVGRSRFVREKDLVDYKDAKDASEEIVKEDTSSVVTTATRVVPVISESYDVEFVAAPEEEEFDLLPVLEKVEVPTVDPNFHEGKKLYSLDELLVLNFDEDAEGVSSGDFPESLLTSFEVVEDDDNTVEVLTTTSRSLALPSSYLRFSIAATGALVFLFSPFFFVPDAMKTVATHVYEKVSEEGIFELLADSLSSSTALVFQSLPETETKNSSDKRNEAIEKLAVNVYRSLSEGGVGQLVGDSVVYVGSAAVGNATKVDTPGGFNRFAAGVFTKVSGFFNSAGDFFASLFDFNTDFGTVVVQNTDTSSEEPVSSTDIETVDDSNEVNPSFVVIPSEDPETDQKTIEDIKRSFSDEVTVVPDESGTSGVIKPVFKEVSDDDYLYVLVPIEGKNE